MRYGEVFIAVRYYSGDDERLFISRALLAPAVLPHCSFHSYIRDASSAMLSADAMYCVETGHERSRRLCFASLNFNRIVNRSRVFGIFGLSVQAIAAVLSMNNLMVVPRGTVVSNFWSSVLPR
jgi:hypothetical protein